MIIKQADYQRIHAVINSVLLNANVNPAHRCLYFSALGAYILDKHFNYTPDIRAGLAAYNVGGPNLLTFGEEHEGQLTGNRESFHCWVEVDGWAIDFMAPAFASLHKEQPPIPAKMFQKPLGGMAASILDLTTEGAFYYESTPEVTARHMKVLTESRKVRDFADICVKWFKKSPGTIRRSIGIGKSKDSLRDVRLQGTPLTGVW